MRKYTFLLLVVLFAGQALAWDARGHRIVADIAYHNLTKKARKQVDNVLGVKGMVYAASWADEIKSDTIYPESHGWHFQDLPEGLTHADIDSVRANVKCDGLHLFYAKDSLTQVLKNDKSNADALKFLVHLCGDEFQPMHMGHPSDLGGNRVKMTWFGSKTNLHSLWDRWIIDYTQYSYSEMSARLQNMYKPQKKAIMALSELECLYITYDNTGLIYEYQAMLGTDMPRSYEYKYYYTFRHVLDYQLYAAGIQLAKLLNEIYK